MFSSLERQVNSQRNIDKDPFSKQILKTDPCPYLVNYSLDVLKKTKALDIFNTDKKMFYKE